MKWAACIGLLIAAFAAATAVSACDGEPARQPTSPTVAPAPTPTRTSLPATVPFGAKEVDCGPVEPSSVGEGHVIAVAAAGGDIVGCAEAITVLSDFSRRPGTGPTTVGSWTCDVHGAALGNQEVWCLQDGLIFHTRG